MKARIVIYSLSLSIHEKKLSLWRGGRGRRGGGGGGRGGESIRCERYAFKDKKGKSV